MHEVGGEGGEVEGVALCGAEGDAGEGVDREDFTGGADAIVLEGAGGGDEGVQALPRGGEFVGCACE